METGLKKGSCCRCTSRFFMFKYWRVDRLKSVSLNRTGRTTCLWWDHVFHLNVRVVNSQEGNQSAGLQLWGSLIFHLTWFQLISFSAFSRCMHCIVPLEPVLRRLSRSLQPESCRTRPFRLQPPTLQLTLRPMLLAGPSNLSHKLTRTDTHICSHIQTCTHTLKGSGCTTLALQSLKSNWICLWMLLWCVALQQKKTKTKKNKELAEMTRELHPELSTFP